MSKSIVLHLNDCLQFKVFRFNGDAQEDKITQLSTLYIFMVHFILPTFSKAFGNCSIFYIIKLQIILRIFDWLNRSM